MFTLKEYEYCNIYYNLDEDIEIIVSTVDWVGTDIYCCGDHIISTHSFEDAIEQLEQLGVKFVVEGGLI